MRKSLYSLLALLMALTLILSACRSAAPATTEPTTAPTKAPAVVPTEAPAVAPTEAPTEAPAPTEAVAEGDCKEDLTGETIVFYSQAGLTGALSTILGTSFVNALNDSIRDLNAQGGICGATVKLDLVDTQYDPAQEIAAYDVNRKKVPPPISIATYGSGASEALKERVKEDKIPNIAAGLSANAFYNPADGYTIGMAPIYSDQFAGFLTWLKDNWADVKKEGAGDDIVVGPIGWEGPFGAGATTPEALKVAEDLGITVLPLETYPISAEADVVSPLQSLQLQGANVIWIQSLGFGTAQVIGTLHALDMWDKMVVGGNNWTINQDVLNVLADKAAAMVGYYGVFPYLYWNDTENEGVQAATKAFEAGGYPATDKGVSYLTSYVGTFTWAETIKKAVNEYGYDNLSGETFMKVFQELGTIPVYGGVWTYDVRDGTRAPRQSQIREVKMVGDKIEFVVVQDWFELPDTRPTP